MKKNVTKQKPDIHQWLQAYIANLYQQPIDTIDLSLSLDELALDSVSVVSIAGELETLLAGIEIDAALMYEFASLELFCDQLALRYQQLQDKQATENGLPLNLSLAASFTAEPIADSLSYWLKQVGYVSQIEFAGYQQIFQALMTPSSAFYQTKNTILLLRLEDFFRFEKEHQALSDKATNIVEQLIQAVSQFMQRHNPHLLIGFCPHSADTVRKLGLSGILETLDQQMIQGFSSITGITVLDMRYLEQNYQIRKTHDPSRDAFGHIPFTPEFFTAMGYHLARQIFHDSQAAKKVLVLDCDNTLWQGIVGEDGVDGLTMTPQNQALQAFAIQQQQAGRIICLCSKNNKADVEAVFHARKDMPLKSEHLVTQKINWRPKSENIRALSQELDLGLDSFIFIDDNPAECLEVSATLPQVSCIQFDPNKDDMATYLAHYWLFDIQQVTDEDRQRTALYQQNQQRQQHQAGFSQYADFVRDLNVQCAFSLLGNDKLTRAAQLSHRTNQFNTTTIRRTEAEMQKLQQSPQYDVLCVNVSDKFGDYGFVGLLIGRADEQYYHCESFMMSCRVLGKQVEQNMLRELATYAKQRGFDTLVVDFSKSDKNAPVEQFLQRLAGNEQNKQGVTLALASLEKILTNSIQPFDTQEDKLPVKSHNNAVLYSDLQAISNHELTTALDALASLKGNTNLMLDALKSQNKIQRGNLPTDFVAPRTAWHKNIAAIWCDVLGLDRVGIHDSFFELGGDSLRAAEAFARMWELGVSDSISLINIPEPTVAMLCQAIEDVRAGKTPTLITDQFSLADEGKLPDDIHHHDYDIHSYNTPMRHVFMTGATGYLGASLLAELFAQTDVTVKCLVRAATKQEAKQRVINNLSTYHLWQADYENRLSVVLGELSEPNLGLTEQAFHTLGEEIDTIFHSGAWVNFVFPYQRLKPSHVDAMETILRLCVIAKPKPIALHFISTLGVIMSTGYSKDDIIMEDEPLQHVEGLLNGYEQAKHVADKMAYEGMQRGIPTAIYRPGMVGGFSDTGAYYKKDEFLSSFYKGCIQLGSWPLLDTTWEVIPVDFLCKAIIHGAKDSNNLNQTYFTLHPEPTPVAEYIQWFQKLGYPMRALPWDVWKRELIAQGADKLKKNALFPFIDFIRALEHEQVRFPTTNRDNFNRLVTEAGLEIPHQAQVLEKYIHYFIETNYVAPPKAMQQISSSPFQQMGYVGSQSCPLNTF